MNVEVISATDNPITIISRAAGISHGKDDESIERVQRCIESGHDSVLEHVSATFAIRGISRACSHQLVRHRIMAVVEKSQRYTAIDSGDFVRVQAVMDDDETNEIYLSAIETAFEAYAALVERGIKHEDARYVLPQATKTDVVLTVNLREFDHILDVRDTDAAQREIRRVVQMMRRELGRYGQEWAALLWMLDARRKKE